MKTSHGFTPNKLALAVALALNGSLAQAAVDCTVSVASDDGTGNTTNTLSWAIKTANTDVIAANGHPGGGCTNNTITLTTDVTLTGVMKRLIDSDLTLTSDGTTRTISGGDKYRPLFVKSGTVTLSNLTLQKGLAQGGSSYEGGRGAGLGGALFVYDGNVTVQKVTFSGNNAIGGQNTTTTGDFWGGGGLFGRSASGIAKGGGGGLFGNGPGKGGGYGGTGNYGGFAGTYKAGSDGGAGGFGGGGAYGSSFNHDGGAGGFGAGGGYGRSGGGNGGFGGGGGGGIPGGGGSGKGYGGFGGGGGKGGVNGTAGGYGGGRGSNSHGGGGAGFGGAIFVKKGTLTLQEVTFTGNSTAKGTGANDGQGKGGAIFICTRDLDSDSSAAGAQGGCSGLINETNSYGVTFSGGAAADGQGDLFWKGASGGAHSTAEITKPLCRVTETNDDGTGDTANTLSWAIKTANTDVVAADGHPGEGCKDNTITLATDVTLTGVMTRLIDSDLTLTSDGTTRIISGNSKYRPLFVKSGTVTIKDLNLEDGVAQGGNSTYGGAGAGLGGALFVYSGDVTVSNVTFYKNKAVGGSLDTSTDSHINSGGGMYGNGAGGDLKGGSGGGLFASGTAFTGTNGQSGSGVSGGYGGFGNYYGGADKFGGGGTFNRTSEGNSGGFGGGGAAGGTSSTSTGWGSCLKARQGGNGGFGGGAGPGGYAECTGDVNEDAGAAGFGGGGGGAGVDGKSKFSARSYGGFGGGRGSSSWLGRGGAGAGFGGAIFVKKGTLTLQDVKFNLSHAFAGDNSGGDIEATSMGGAIFICTSDLDTDNSAKGAMGGCDGEIDETNSYRVEFVDTLADEQYDLFWTGAANGAHSTRGIIDNPVTIFSADLSVSSNSTSQSTASRAALSAQTLDRLKVALNQRIERTWTVTNLGPDTAPAVTWRASLPLGLGLDQITPSQGQCGGVREIACELGELPVNGRITLPIAVVALQAGTWSQSATVTSPVADPHPDNNTAQFELIVASAAETFVEFLSAQLLARPLSAEEQVWIDRLEQGQLTPAALIAEMLALAEYRQRVLPIARLYPTILGRDPDLAGLHDWVNSLPWEPALATPANSVDPTDPVTNDLNNMELINWIHQTSTGQALVAIAAAFLQSAEFIERFGASLDDEAFITLLYQNALNRRPDPAGRAWWIRELTAGRDRAEVALLFAHTNEQRTTRDRKLGLALLYQILLGRLPTDAEVADALTREITEVIAALLVHPDYIGPPQP